MCWLAMVALWQVGCVIPPAEMELAENRLPYIDWALTLPSEIEVAISKDSLSVTTFSIEDAAIDPDGDEIEAIWYWVAEDELPHREFGELSMNLDAVCLGVQALRDSQSITVEVVISDRPGALKWVGEVGNQVDPGLDDEGKPMPLIKHVWVVELTGECK
jgi:hypothetical protein